MTSGFQLAFWVGAAIAIVGVVAALVLIRQEEVEVAPEAGARGRLEQACSKLEQLRGAADHDVGGLAQLRRALRARRPRPGRRARARPAAANASRSVVSSPGVERALRAALAEQVRDGRALVRVERRPQLEHLPAEAGDEPLVPRPGGDLLEQCASASASFAGAAVVEADRERLPLDVLPVDGRREALEPLAPGSGLRLELEPVLADVDRARRAPTTRRASAPERPLMQATSAYRRVQAQSSARVSSGTAASCGHVDDRREHAVDVEQDRRRSGRLGEAREQAVAVHPP